MFFSLINIYAVFRGIFIVLHLFLFTQIILYLRMCLAHSAGLDPTCQSLADMQDQAPAIGRYVRELMTNGFTDLESTYSKIEDMNPVEMYISLMQQLLSSAGGSH